MLSTPHILLTIDVEDWFQVENLRPCCPISSWPSFELRVEKNTHRLLDLFDEASSQPFESLKALSQVEGQSAVSDQRSAISVQPTALNNKSCLTSPSRRIRATFFVLAWIAERCPQLVREIHSRGHEVASHGCNHELCSQCSTDDLREDLAKSKKLLEDIIGAPVYGYRAPSFSISDEIIKLIEEAGYLYDSSYNSFGVHGRYGTMSLNGGERSGIAILLNQKSTIESRKFYELPISNLSLSPFRTLGNLGTLAEGPERSRRAHLRHFCLPWGGGAYFRLIPAPLFRIGVREILRRQQAYLFYMHPWEVDADQPRPKGATAFSRFKHYTNLSRTEGKLGSLLKNFAECSFVACYEHLEREGAPKSV